MKRLSKDFSHWRWDVDDLGNQEVALSQMGSVYYRQNGLRPNGRVLGDGSGVSKTIIARATQN